MIKVLEGQRTKNTTVNLRVLGVIAVCIIGFFMGRGNIEGISPMVIAYFVGCYSYKKIRMWVFAGLLVGMVTSLLVQDIIRYLAVMVLFSFLYGLFERRMKNRTRGIAPFLGLIAALIIGAMAMKSSFITLEPRILLLIEPFFVLFLANLFQKGIKTIMQDNTGDGFEEQVLSFATIALMMSIGVLGMHLLDFSLLHIFALNLILYLGYQYGLDFSAVMGVAIGFSTIIGNNGIGRDGFILWSILGIVAGIFREMGKIGTIIAYGITYLLLLHTFGQGGIELKNIELLLVSGGTFLILPVRKREKKNVKVATSINLDSDIAHRLEEFSKVYENLAKTFMANGSNKMRLSKLEINQLIEQLANTVCKDCSMCNLCWEKDFYNTYKTIYSVLSAVENRGEVAEEDIPPEFYEHCGKVEQFVIMLNRLYDIYKTNLRWENRINEQKEVFAEQYSHMAHLIGNLAKELALNPVKFSAQIKRYLDFFTRESVDVKNIWIHEMTSGHNEIIMEFPQETPADKIRELLPVINHFEGIKYQIREILRDTEQSGLKCIYVPGDRYRFVKGYARINKKRQEVSGDAYTLLDLEGGIDLVALSDGMGSGNNAFLESSATIRMLEQMVESGFDLKIAVKTINAVLGVRSNYQLFSTLDIGMMNRVTGECDFIKNGAVATYLKRGQEVELIQTEALPLGMFRAVDPVVIRKSLKADDLIVMVSDGVSDAGRGDKNEEDWIIGALKSINGLNPQKISDDLIDFAKGKYEGNVKDDMTVLAVRVWERNGTVSY